MKITLNEEKTAMWFLGDPKEVRAQLNFVNPGPIEVDFITLPESEKIKVLNDLLRGVIISDSAYEDLYLVYLRGKAPETTEPTNVIEQLEQPVIQQAEQQQVVPEIHPVIKKKVAEISKKKIDRCNLLVKKSFTELKKLLPSEKDPRVLHELLKMENNKKKPRPSVTSLIEIEIKKQQLKKLEVIHEEMATRNKKVSDPFLPYDELVIESDNEVILLTPEELVID